MDYKYQLKQYVYPLELMVLLRVICIVTPYKVHVLLLVLLHMGIRGRGINRLTP